MADQSVDSSGLDFNREEYSDSSPEDVAKKYSEIIEAFTHLFEALLHCDRSFDAIKRRAIDDAQNIVKSMLDQFGDAVNFNTPTKACNQLQIYGRCKIALNTYEKYTDTL